jgi:hypothetical protein
MVKGWWTEQERVDDVHRGLFTHLSKNNGGASDTRNVVIDTARNAP